MRGLHIIMTFTKFIEQIFDMCGGLGKCSLTKRVPPLPVEEFNESSLCPFEFFDECFIKFFWKVICNKK